VLLVPISFLFLGPLLGILSQSSISIIQEQISLNSTMKSLWITLASAGVSSLLAVVLAIYFARWFALNNWQFKRIQRLFIICPYLIPNFIVATSYVIAWNPTTGLLNWLFKFPFGLYGFWGMSFLFAITHMPVAFLVFEEKFRKIDPAWREAAQLAGASDFAILVQIELPLMMPSLISVFSLCFGLCISSFAIPAWIGAPSHVYPMTYKIYQALQLGGVDGIPEAAGLSLLLLGLTLLPLILNSLAQKSEKKLTLVSGKGSRIGGNEKRRASLNFFQIIFFFYNGLTWFLPLSVLALSTLVRPGCLQENGLSCFSEITFSTYKYVLFDMKETHEAFLGSFVFGGIAALLIIGMSLLTLILFNNSKYVKQILEWIYSLPLATPGIVLALGLIITGSGKFGINIYNTVWILIAAYIIKHLSLAFQTLRISLTSISPSIVEAGRLAGANSREIWQGILIPLLKPEILGGFFLVFLPILSELTMSVMLVGPTTKNIGALIFQLQDYADQASASVLSIFLVVVILIINELTRYISRGKLGY
jgi:iron(III) transport system permease protein